MAYAGFVINHAVGCFFVGGGGGKLGDEKVGTRPEKRSKIFSSERNEQQGANGWMVKQGSWPLSQRALQHRAVGWQRVQNRSGGDKIR